MESVQEAIDKAVKQERDKWVAAIDAEMVSFHLGIFNDGDDPRVAINKLLSWSQVVALDPTVSSEARALIDRGRAEGEETKRYPK